MKIDKVAPFFRKIHSKSMENALFKKPSGLGLLFRQKMLNHPENFFGSRKRIRNGCTLRSYLYLKNPWRDIKNYDDVVVTVIDVVPVI